MPKFGRCHLFLMMVKSLFNAVEFYPLQELYMNQLFKLCGRGLRYVRQYGPAQLYYKIKERRERNQAEAGYEAWLKERLEEEKATVKEAEELSKKGPLISVLVPAYETPPLFLRQMIESVLEQSYGNLELCIADGSPSDQVRQIAEEYAGKDSRLHYEKLNQNLGISENTNAALSMAKGDYIGLLDHDDLLLPGALYEVAGILYKAGGADAVYTDEDKVNMDLTHHFQPHFKPDFNSEYLLSNNYICHFFVVKRELAQRVGGFREAFDGAQDYDFILRCTERAERVLHIPKVLYSWRCHEASTAANPESKLYAYEAGKQAVAAHLKRMGIRGEVLSTSNYGFHRIRFHWEDPKILIKSFANLNGQMGVKVVYYDKACNNSVTIPRNSDYVLFAHVRNAGLSEGFLEELCACCERPKVGIACARVYDKKKRLTSDICMEGVKDSFGGSMQGLKEGCTGYFHRAVLHQELVSPTDCFLVKGKLLRGVDHLTVEELCTHITKQGYRIVYNPWAVVYESR